MRRQWEKYLSRAWRPVAALTRDTNIIKALMTQRAARWGEAATICHLDAVCRGHSSLAMVPHRSENRTLTAKLADHARARWWGYLTLAQ